MNKTLVEEYCQARLITCGKLILTLKPARERSQDLNVEMVTNICDAIINVVENALQNGIVIASLLNRPLTVHNQRAQVIFAFFLYLYAC